MIQHGRRFIYRGSRRKNDMKRFAAFLFLLTKLLRCGLLLEIWPIYSLSLPNKEPLVEIKRDANTDYEIKELKRIIVSSLRSLFGEYGANNEVDILRYNKKEGTLILRCLSNFYVKLRSSLSLYINSESVGIISLLEEKMSTCRKEGKDIIIFATADDHKEPSKVTLPEPEPQPGLILPNGEINWNCPCLGGMATGPCGVEFREAFSCFHNSVAEPKGSDCYDAFREMHLCMAEYPSLYAKYDDDERDLASLDLDETLEDNKTDKISEQLNSVKAEDSSREIVPGDKKGGT